MKLFSTLNYFKTNDSAATILIRIMVAAVFLPDGIQKLVVSGLLGREQFASIGLPLPDLLGPFVGVVELVCGLFILLGFLTRLSSIPLMIIALVAIVSTKIPVLLGENWWIFHVEELPHYGFWAMMQMIRDDVSMFFASLYLLVRGAGRCSFDAAIYSNLKVKHHYIADPDNR